eukprot:13653198-Alexandrium_andersonii.AAC.1
MGVGSIAEQRFLQLPAPAAGDASCPHLPMLLSASPQPPRAPSLVLLARWRRLFGGVHARGGSHP